MNKPIVGITMGDPAGSGPEITIKALADPEQYTYCRPIVVGDVKVFEQARKFVGREDIVIHRCDKVLDALFTPGTIDVLHLDLIEDINKFEMAKVSVEGGNAAFQCVKKVIELAMAGEVDATCTTDGNKEYYRCTCGKLFEDAAAATEITDHSSVVIPKTGHSYTVQNSDEAHRRSTAADCREFDTYWYTCANDATHSAKDDAAAADKFYNGKQGAHVYGSEWVDCGETGHAHKCQYHDAYDAVQPHTPDHEGGATYDYAVKCTGCGRVLEPQRENGSIRVEVPFKLTVKKTGEMDPGQETFKFAIDRFGAPTVYTLVQDTVETNGEKTYEGKFIFTISKDQAGNLSEGFVIHQVKGNAAGWTYDESIFYAMPLFVDSYDSVRGWAFYRFDEKGELEYNNPMEEIGFTNSYSAKKPVTPPAPEPPEKPVTPPAPETPKTGDGSMIAFSIAMAIVSGAALMGAALYSRRRSR